MPDRKFEISFGIPYGSLEEQLKSQKLNFDKLRIAQFELQREAIIRCLLGGLITKSVSDKAYGKLFKNLTKHLNLKNKI